MLIVRLGKWDNVQIESHGLKMENEMMCRVKALLSFWLHMDPSVKAHKNVGRFAKPVVGQWKIRHP